MDAAPYQTPPPVTQAYPPSLQTLATLAADPIAGLVSTAWVGRLGAPELAAVGVALSVFNTITKLLNMPILSVTTSSVASALGKANGVPLPLLLGGGALLLQCPIEQLAQQAASAPAPCAPRARSHHVQPPPAPIRAPPQTHTAATWARRCRQPSCWPC